MKISADAPAVVHGLGLFETMRLFRARVQHVERHFARMRASAEMLGFPVPTYSRFTAEIERAIAGAGAREAAVRCSWLSGSSEWLMSASASDIPDVTLRRRRLGRLATLGRDLVRSLPQHKLTSYAVCVVGLQRAIAAGADEGLFVDARGRGLEGTSTNVFAVVGETLITPPVRAGILPGVTRGIVIEKATSMGLRVIERKLVRDDFLGGSFLTGSLTTVCPIRMLDGTACDAPPRELIRELRAAAR